MQLPTFQRLTASRCSRRTSVSICSEAHVVHAIAHRRMPSAFFWTSLVPFRRTQSSHAYLCTHCIHGGLAGPHGLGHAGRAHRAGQRGLRPAAVQRRELHQRFHDGHGRLGRRCTIPLIGLTPHGCNTLCDGRTRNVDHRGHSDRLRMRCRKMEWTRIVTPPASQSLHF